MPKARAKGRLKAKRSFKIRDGRKEESKPELILHFERCILDTNASSKTYDYPDQCRNWDFCKRIPFEEKGNKEDSNLSYFAPDIPGHIEFDGSNGKTLHKTFISNLLTGIVSERGKYKEIQN